MFKKVFMWNLKPFKEYIQAVRNADMHTYLGTQIWKKVTVWSTTFLLLKSWLLNVPEGPEDPFPSERNFPSNWECTCTCTYTHNLHNVCNVFIPKWAMLRTIVVQISDTCHWVGTVQDLALLINLLSVGYFLFFDVYMSVGIKASLCWVLCNRIMKDRDKLTACKWVA